MLFNSKPDFDGFMPDGMNGTEYLIRSKRSEMQNIRDLITTWFNNYPESEKANWKASFFSYRKEQHNSAFFELFLHEILIRSGWEVTVHPMIEGTNNRPDFLCKNAETSFYLEAKVATGKSQDEEKAIVRLETVIEQVNRKVKSTFFSLAIETEGLPDKMIGSLRLVQGLSSWLTSLDHDHWRQQTEKPKYVFEEFGLKIIFEAYPKPTPQESESIISVFMYGHEGGVIRPHASIRSSIEKKSNRYGSDLDRPYVIAINTLGTFADVFRDALDALYGDPCISYKVGVLGGDPQWDREANGNFSVRDRERKPQVSGAIIFSNIHPCAYYQKAHGLYVPNVSAALPMTTPFPILSYMQDNKNHLALIKQGTAGDILDTPENWPNSSTT